MIGRDIEHADLHELTRAPCCRVDGVSLDETVHIGRWWVSRSGVVCGPCGHAGAVSLFTRLCGSMTFVRVSGPQRKALHVVAFVSSHH